MLTIEGHDQKAHHKLGLSSELEFPIIDTKALLQLAEWVELQLTTHGGESCKNPTVLPPARTETHAQCSFVDGAQRIGAEEGSNTSGENADKSRDRRRSGGVS